MIKGLSARVSQDLQSSFGRFPDFAGPALPPGALPCQGFIDHHVRIRQQRPLPLSVGITLVLVGLGLMVGLGAPWDLLALVVVMITELALSVPATLFWTVSIHVAGAVVILSLFFDCQMRRAVLTER